MTLVDQYTGMREPEVSIYPMAIKKNGIKEFDLKDKKLNREKCKKLLAQADFLIAHNASFDKRFMIKEFDFLKSKEWLCSYRDIKWSDKGFESRKLFNLVNHHEIKFENAHRSKSDTEALFHLLNQKASPQTTYFNQLLRNNKIKQKEIDFN